MFTLLRIWLTWRDRLLIYYTVCLLLRCILDWVNNLPKFTTPHLTPLSYSMNISPFLTRSHLFPDLAITMFVSFAVSVHTSTPKQLRPLPLPLFTPSLTAATLYRNLLKSQITRLQQIKLLHVLLLKLRNDLYCVEWGIKLPSQSSQIRSHHFYCIRSLHWLKITSALNTSSFHLPTKSWQPYPTFISA